MATPAPTTPSSPPTLPTSNDAESTFDVLWDAFNAWLTTTLWPYLGAVSGSTAANATEAETAATTATAQALAAIDAKNNAEQAVVAATAVAGSTQWAAGNYATGAVVWSPTNGQNYRRKSPGGSSPTDPASDPTNWYSLVSLQGLSVVAIAANTAGVVGRHYVITANCTLTLPAAPGVNELIAITVVGDTVNAAVIGRNGQKINGLSEDMTIDRTWATARFIYTGATYGWVLS